MLFCKRLHTGFVVVVLLLFFRFFILFFYLFGWLVGWLLLLLLLSLLFVWVFRFVVVVTFTLPYQHGTADPFSAVKVPSQASNYSCKTPSVQHLLGPSKQPDVGEHSTSLAKLRSREHLRLEDTPRTAHVTRSSQKSPAALKRGADDLRFCLSGTLCLTPARKI